MVALLFYILEQEMGQVLETQAGSNKNSLLSLKLIFSWDKIMESSMRVHARTCALGGGEREKERDWESKREICKG